MLFSVMAVLIIVDCVTNLGKVEFNSHEEQLAENHRKMLMPMSMDIQSFALVRARLRRAGMNIRFLDISQRRMYGLDI